MESRRRGERWAFGQDVIQRSKALRACKHVALLVVWTMIGLLAADGSAIAQTTHYTYDANGGLLTAIQEHAGPGSEANVVIRLFEQLNNQQQQDLLNFLRSL